MRVIAGLSLFFGLSLQAKAALPGVDFLVDESEYRTREFVAECQTALEDASARTSIVERNLSLTPGTLEVDEEIVMSPADPRRHLPQTYSCILELRSGDPSVKFTKDSTPLRTHLPKGEQDTACVPDFKDVAADPGSLYAQYETGWTLFQGRLCSVAYVRAAKRTSDH